MNMSEQAKKLNILPLIAILAAVLCEAVVFSNGRKDESVRTKAVTVSSCEAMVIPVCGGASRSAFHPLLLGRRVGHSLRGFMPCCHCRPCGLWPLPQENR